MERFLAQIFEPVWFLEQAAAWAAFQSRSDKVVFVSCEVSGTTRGNVPLPTEREIKLWGEHFGFVPKSRGGLRGLPGY